MNIRIATTKDSNHIYKVHFSAFPEEERDIVAKLATNLLAEESTPQIISLVAESDSIVVGHIAFSPLKIDRKNWIGYILAPLGVMPEYQNKSIGSKLIQSGVKRLLEMEVNMLFVYGDPKFYGRFGFNAETASKYYTSYELQYPFGWQAITLNDCSNITEPVTINCVESLSDPKLW